MFPYQHKRPGRRRRPAAASSWPHWITSKENQYFARSYVNRLWSYLLGVGLIEPIDDIRAGNPPTNPKLLDRLTEEFVKSGFNTRARDADRSASRGPISTRSSTNNWNEDDEINYSHALARRLPAEVLYDAIHRATGSASRLPGLPPGARAAQLLDSNVRRRPAASSTCSASRRARAPASASASGGMMLGPVLNLVNGPVVATPLKDPNNRIAKLLAAEKDDAEADRGALPGLPVPAADGPRDRSWR